MFHRVSRWRLIIIVSVLGALAAWGVAMYVVAPRPTPEIRGYALAEELGCHGCHGPRGTGGIPNPRSDEAEIPSWDGGTAMMYVKDEGEIREWILDGMPRRLEQEHAGHDHGGARLPVRMPAFRSVLDENEIEDLVAYYKVVAAWDEIPERARRGYTVASERGCFGCHGPRGLIGARNRKSLKGYIPPWRGSDFSELVKNDDELRSWIQDGNLPRFERNPLAQFFTHRQVIQMPAYRDVIDESELVDLVAYIQWLQQRE